MIIDIKIAILFIILYSTYNYIMMIALSELDTFMQKLAVSPEKSLKLSSIPWLFLGDSVWFFELRPIVFPWARLHNPIPIWQTSSQRKYRWFWIFWKLHLQGDYTLEDGRLDPLFKISRCSLSCQYKYLLDPEVPAPLETIPQKEFQFFISFLWLHTARDTHP